MEYTELNTLKKEIRLLNLAPKYPASDTPKDLENIEGLQPPPDICCTLRVVSLFDQPIRSSVIRVGGARYRHLYPGEWESSPGHKESSYSLALSAV